MIAKPPKVELSVPESIEIAVALLIVMALLYTISHFSTFVLSSKEVRATVSKRMGGLQIFWCAFSAAIHFLIDGPYGLARSTWYFKKGLDTFGMADFRYAEPMEPGIITIEAITGVLTGPACVLVMIAAFNDLSWRWPM